MALRSRELGRKVGAAAFRSDRHSPRAGARARRPFSHTRPLLWGENVVLIQSAGRVPARAARRRGRSCAGRGVTPINTARRRRARALFPVRPLATWRALTATPLEQQQFRLTLVSTRVCRRSSALLRSPLNVVHVWSRVQQRQRHRQRLLLNPPFLWPCNPQPVMRTLILAQGSMSCRGRPPRGRMTPLHLRPPAHLQQRRRRARDTARRPPRTHSPLATATLSRYPCTNLPLRHRLHPRTAHACGAAWWRCSRALALQRVGRFQTPQPSPLPLAWRHPTHPPPTT